MNKSVLTSLVLLGLFLGAAVNAAVFMEPGPVGLGMDCGWRHELGLLETGIVALVYCAVFSFVFSVIFWLVYRWIIKK